MQGVGSVEFPERYSKTEGMSAKILGPLFLQHNNNCPLSPVNTT